jgi:CRISPR-associated endonuclease Cas1
MRTQATDSPAAWPADVVAPSGVLVLRGYGLDVRVWRGRLRIRDGVGADRRDVIVHRATGRLRRLVVLGHTGSVSLDAIRWLADVGAGYLQVDGEGRVLAAFGPQGTDRPGLRRAQARALDTPTGNDVVRHLLAEKISAQAETLVAVDHVAPVAADAAGALRSAGAALHGATTRDGLRLAEAQAALAYWAAWSQVPVTFARRDADRVPAHWRAFGTRASPLTGNPRLAANPANALLNYLYAILEGEATIAARVVGLDPGVGLLHADQLNRDSLSADIMEPVRPLVDRFVLGLLAERYFAASDFYETREGVCRVTPPLARDLAATASVWARAVGRVAEDVARLLDTDRPSPRGMPTPISGRNRRVGRGKPQARPSSRPRLRGACRWCGGATPSGRRTCSDGCRAAVEAANLKAFIELGTRTLDRVRQPGSHPMTELGRARFGRRTSSLVAAARDWQRTHDWPSDMGAFAREVLPRLASVSVGRLSRATGLSEAYCRQIKSGEAVPHPMWWETLGQLVR